MYLIDNYNAALRALFDHMGCPNFWEMSIIDSTMFYWRLGLGKVIYDHKKEVNENSFSSPLMKKGYWEKIHYSGKDLTCLVTGKELGRETLQIFSNDKYVGNAKAEKIYL